MANTANDLAREVGLELGIIDSVTSLSAEDLTDLNNGSRRKHAELTKRHICYWDYDDIPDEVFHPLALYLASCFGKQFGKTIKDEPLSVAQTRQARLADLITVAAPGYSGSVLVTEQI